MKLNIKRAALGLCMAACLFSLSACSKAETETTINADVQSNMEQSMPSLLDFFTSIPEEQLEAVHAEAVNNDNLIVAEAVDSWKNVIHDLGAFDSVDSVVKVEEIDGGYNATVNAVFEKRQMEFGITVTRDLSEITGISFSPVYTLGENMEQAFMNMIIGMGTVFLVLIFISLLISCFKYINIFEEKMKNKKNKIEAAPAHFAENPPVIQAAPVQEENLADDMELVAVITAAIAASTGSNPSGLVVRSIRRAPAGKWNKA